MTQKKRYRKERPPKMIRFFFWEDKLHQTLLIDRPRNILVAWSYPEGKKVQFVYSHIRVHRNRAWRTSEVAKLVNRSMVTLRKAIREEKIRRPQKTYSIDEEGNKYPGIMFWSSKDIYDLHEYLLSLRQPNHRTPSRMELVSRMEEGVSYLIEDEDGNKTRVFKGDMW